MKPRNNNHPTDGSVTLVTGATSGIGEGIALTLSATHDLVLHGRDDTRLESIRGRCARPERHRVWKCDLAAVEDAGKSLADFLAANQLGVRNFIHSAGVAKVAGIRQTNSVDGVALFKVNVFSALAIIGTLVRSAAERGELRSIVLISSASSLRGEKGAALYSASKGAIDALVKSLAVELAPSVRVNAVLPGLVRTRMAESTLRSPEFEEVARRKYPLGVGEVQDVVSTVEHLVSDRARWVTGALWSVDGGRTAV